MAFLPDTQQAKRSATRPTCMACGGQSWIMLPTFPGSMLSDGRRFNQALAKESCVGCGLARHSRDLNSLEVREIFDDQYQLAIQPIDERFLRQRQRHYANWIRSLLPDEKCLAIFDIGAANGSLLAELATSEPQWKVAGIEPVDAAAGIGRSAGYNVETAFLDDYDMSSVGADVVLSVNVIEHVVDPASFLTMARAGIRRGGRILIICPDGGTPSTELLIYDHIHSFTRSAMECLARNAGLKIATYATAPAAIGPFHAFVMVESDDEAHSAPPDQEGLIHSRIAFMEAWKRLDALLETRLRGGPETFAFGYGESAQLLRAYAPRAWGHVKGILADASGNFDGRAVDLYHAPEIRGSRKILLAIRPDLQRTLGERLSRDGDIVVTWDDLAVTDA